MTSTTGPDNLRDRIAAVLSGHIEDQITNYDAERNECGCGHQGSATYREHLADAVIEALDLREELWSTTDPVQLRRSWGKSPKYRRYVTDWIADE